MKPGTSNKLPIWARFFAVLFGIPLASALLRTGFEREFPKATALMLASVALYLYLHWQLAARPATPPTSKDESKRERRRFDFALALFLSAVFLAGTVMFLVIGVFPPADMPFASRWVIRVALFLIGVLCFFICLSLILQGQFFLTGKRGVTLRLGKSGTHK